MVVLSRSITKDSAIFVALSIFKCRKPDMQKYRTVSTVIYPINGGSYVMLATRQDA